MNGKSLLVFDMDGVLIDVTGSYREVTRLTVVLYLGRVLGAGIQYNGFLSRSDVAAIKKRGGLNNDWDLTDAILDAYLLHALKDSLETDLDSRLQAVREIAWDHEVIRELRHIMQRVDLSGLEDLVRERKAPQLFAALSRYGGARSPFLFNHGDVKTGNLSKRIFQEVYLGRNLFIETYGEEPIFHRDEGYIGRERMIPSPAELDELASSHILSIATGRPAVEARYALDRFGIGHRFTTVVSEDDVVEAEKHTDKSLRKPNPFSLNLCAARSGCGEADRRYYVGDMPDDMVAALGAGMAALGFVNYESGEGEKETKEHRAVLRNKGAEAVFGSFRELIAYLDRC
jgi:phosphoglycolate phosphatase-like HAD superfamily hydrolase